MCKETAPLPPQAMRVISFIGFEKGLLIDNKTSEIYCNSVLIVKFITRFKNSELSHGISRILTVFD